MNAMLPAVIEPEIIEGEFGEAPSRGALISYGLRVISSG